MRFPVFARRSNPSIDRPILRKSLAYVTDQVDAGRADWIDPTNPAKGIIAREMLHFGVRDLKAETADPLNYDWAELPGIRYVPAKMEKNPTLPRLEMETLSAAAPTWDWSYEARA
jgi:hypothetical protein